MRPPTTLSVTVGDTIDFLVGFGGNSAAYDTTLVDAQISMQVASTSVPVTVAVVDGQGGTAEQRFDIAIHPTLGNHDPLFVSTPIKILPLFQPEFTSRVLDTLDAGSVITGLAISDDNKLYIGNLSGPIYQRDLATGAVSVLKASGFTSSARMVVANGNDFGTDLVHADFNVEPGTSCCQGTVYRTNRVSGQSTVLQVGAVGRSAGDPFGIAIGRGGAFGTDLYVMDFQ